MKRLLALMSVLALAACAPEPLIPVPYRTPEATATSTAEAGVSTSQSPTAESSRTTATAQPVDECRMLAEDLTLHEQVGQLFMLGVDTGGLDTPTQSAIIDSRVGSVVLLGNSTAGTRAIRNLTAQLGSLGTSKLPMLIAVDQEGGTVQRLKGEGFSTIPAARDQGAMSPADLEQAAATWAEELRAAGVHYDLAPATDLVPEAKRASNEPIGRLKRDFGADPQQVSEAAVAFIKGMQSEGIVTSAKHFPGLGEVVTNTDFGAAEDNDVTRDSIHIEPFVAAIQEGVDSVMVSSAVFTHLDPDNEGVFSHVVITDLLRGDLGYDGVVIADDLGAAAAVAGVEPGQRAVRFLQAGGDLVINANPRIMKSMADAVKEAAAADAAFADQVVDSTARVLRLKSTAGLGTC